MPALTRLRDSTDFEPLWDERVRTGKSCQDDTSRPKSCHHTTFNYVTLGELTCCKLALNNHDFHEELVVAVPPVSFLFLSSCPRRCPGGAKEARCG